MKFSKQKLLEVINNFEGTPMLVAGDLIVDSYIFGEVNRISPEAPVVVVKSTEESRRLGGAGNVASNMACLGADVTLCGVIGDDNSGKALTELMEEKGIKTDSLIVDSSRQTTVKTRVIAHAQQVVRVDREDTHELSDKECKKINKAIESKIDSVKSIVISDYGKGFVTESLCNKLSVLHKDGALGLDRTPLIVDPKQRNFPLYSYASVITPNRLEAEFASGLEIVGRESAIPAGHLLLERWGCDMVLITLGEHGMVLVPKSELAQTVVEIDTVAQEVYDVSGAGDTVSAVFSLALAVGAGAKEAAILANLAAGVVVAEVGTAPILLEQLKHEVESKGE